MCDMTNETNLQLMMAKLRTFTVGPELDHNQTQQQGPQLWKTHGFKVQKVDLRSKKAVENENKGCVII